MRHRDVWSGLLKLGQTNATLRRTNVRGDNNSVGAISRHPGQNHERVVLIPRAVCPDRLCAAIRPATLPSVFSG